MTVTEAQSARTVLVSYWTANGSGLHHTELPTASLGKVAVELEHPPAVVTPELVRAMEDLSVERARLHQALVRVQGDLNAALEIARKIDPQIDPDKGAAAAMQNLADRAETMQREANQQIERANQRLKNAGLYL